MELVLQSKVSKLLTLGVLLGGFLLVAVWQMRAYLATRFGRNLTLRSLGLAIAFDPQDSNYHLELGRLLQYSPGDANPERSVAELERATELNPYDPMPWLDVGSAYDFQGNTFASEACLRHADFLAPEVPAIQWAIGNSYLLHGDNDRAFRHYRIVLTHSTLYSAVLFSTVWKASGDGKAILANVIPNRLSAELDYLGFLIKHRQFDETDAVWKRIINSPGKPPPEEASRYFDSLIDARRPEQAGRVWDEVRAKGLISSAAETGSQNLVEDGDFEQPLLNMGYGWRLAETDDAYAAVDPNVFHSPKHALLIQFLGKENVNYQNVYQLVRVSPNHSYQLQALVKTAGITTDSGPRLAVRDMYDPRALLKYSDDVKGASEGWVPIQLDFKTGAETQLVVISIVRLPSQKLGNQIAGKVWVDDVTLTPAR